MKLNEALSKVENYIVKSVNVEEFAEMKKMAFYFCSSPGVGKSEGIAEMGERIEKLTGKKVYVHDVRLSLFAQTDIFQHISQKTWKKKCLFRLSFL